MLVLCALNLGSDARLRSGGDESELVCRECGFAAPHICSNCGVLAEWHEVNLCALAAPAADAVLAGV
jgi:hypothetical protein